MRSRRIWPRRAPPRKVQPLPDALIQVVAAGAGRGFSANPENSLRRIHRALLSTFRAPLLPSGIFKPDAPMTDESYPRDLVGYGRTTPDPRGRKFSSIQVRGDEGRSRRNKILSLGRLPMDPPLKYSKSYKRLSLGMPKASPSSSAIIGFSHGTIFLFLHTLCSVLGALVCFYFQFVCVSFLVLAIIWIHACLFGRETRSAFSLYTHVLLLSV